MEPLPDVSNRLNASRMSDFCSSDRSSLTAPPLVFRLAPPPVMVSDSCTKPSRLSQGLEATEPTPSVAKECTFPYFSLPAILLPYCVQMFKYRKQCLIDVILQYTTKQFINTFSVPKCHRLDKISVSWSAQIDCSEKQKGHAFRLAQKRT